MGNFKKLSRAEMKNVKGGLTGPPADCENDCSSNSDCSGSYPVCHKSTCQATGKPANICGV